MWGFEKLPFKVQLFFLMNKSVVSQPAFLVEDSRVWDIVMKRKWVYFKLLSLEETDFQMKAYWGV